jgi:hypothetical protein
MQGLMVLLLELSMDGAHLTTDKEFVKNRAEQLVAWLQSMAIVDGVSAHAHAIVSAVLDKQDPAQAMKKHMPHPRMDEAYRQEEPYTFDAQQQYYENNSLATFDDTNMAWPYADAFRSSSFYSLANTGAFYPSEQFGAQCFDQSDAGPSEVQTSMPGGLPFAVDFGTWPWDLVQEEVHRQGQDQDQGGGKEDGEGEFPM